MTTVEQHTWILLGQDNGIMADEASALAHQAAANGYKAKSAGNKDEADRYFAAAKHYFDAAKIRSKIAVDYYNLVLEGYQRAA